MTQTHNHTHVTLLKNNHLELRLVPNREWQIGNLHLKSFNTFTWNQLGCSALSLPIHINPFLAFTRLNQTLSLKHHKRRISRFMLPTGRSNK
jgi:hypothetical protein